MANINPVAGSEFTSEMLAKNFVSIGKEFDGFEKWIGHVEGHVAELSKSVQTLIAKQPKSSKVKPFLLGVVTVVVVAKLVEKNRHKVDQVIQVTKDKADQAKDLLDEQIDGSSN